MDFQLLAQLRLIGRAAESAAEAGRRLRDNSPESTRLAFNMQERWICLALRLTPPGRPVNLAMEDRMDVSAYVWRQLFRWLWRRITKDW